MTDSRDWQPGGKDRQLLCWDCRAHYKKTNELPPLTAPAAVGGVVTNSTASKDPTNKESNGKDSSTKDAGGGKDSNKDKSDKKDEPSYLFRPVAESPDASPQRMRTRNKAAKEQTNASNQNNNRGSRPKRGGELLQIYSPEDTFTQI